MSLSHQTPLTPEQKAMAGDPRLIAMARQLARAKARRHRVLADEFESAALFALVEAAATYVRGGGASFRSHCRRRIHWALLDVQREALPRGFMHQYERRGRAVPRVLSMTTSRHVDARGNPHNEALLRPADEEPVGAGHDYQDQLEGLARRLPRKHGIALRRLYGQAGCGTHEAAARSMGVCEDHVSRLHRQALAMLRDYYHV